MLFVNPGDCLFSLSSMIELLVQFKLKKTPADLKFLYCGCLISTHNTIYKLEKVS